MPQTSQSKLEYIVNPFCRSKDKNMKKVNKAQVNTREIIQTKPPYNVHDPEFEVEAGDKSTPGKCYSETLTFVIAK